MLWALCLCLLTISLFSPAVPEPSSALGSPILGSPDFLPWPIILAVAVVTNGFVPPGWMDEFTLQRGGTGSLPALAKAGVLLSDPACPQDAG